MKKLLGVIVLLLTVFAFLQIPSSDDFCNKVQIDQMGALTYLKHLYVNWTGRYLTSVIAISYFSLLPADYFNVVSLFNLSCYLGALYFLAKLISDSRQFLVWLIFICIFFLGGRTNLAEYIFWPTGGIVYSFSYLIFFGSFWFIQMRRMSFGTLLVVVFIVTSLIETINPAIIVLLYPVFKLQSNKQKFCMLVVFVTASTLLYFAPGNFARANSGNGLEFSLVQLFQNYFFLIYKSLRYAWAPVLLSIIGGLFCKAFGIVMNEQVLRKRWLFMLSGFFSLTPFVFAPEHFNGRSSSLFVMLISTFACLMSFKFLEDRTFKIRFIRAQYSLAIPLLLICLLSLDIFRMVEVRNSFLERSDFLKDKRGLTVAVPSLQGKLPISAHFDDVREDSKHWINACVSRYYSLKSIKTKSL